MVLWSVAAVSSTNVWAIGYYVRNGEYKSRPLVERWDGSAWSIVPTPLEGTQGSLTDIALRKSGWGWVVGGNTIMQACGI